MVFDGIDVGIFIDNNIFVLRMEFFIYLFEILLGSGILKVWVLMLDCLFLEVSRYFCLGISLIFLV